MHEASRHVPSQADPAPKAAGGPAAAPRRPGRGVRDMAMSLLVLLVPLAFLVALFRLRGGEDVVVVDPTPAISQARAAQAFPVVAPSGLSSQWVCVSAAFERTAGSAALRIGYVTPAGGGVQLIESNEPAGMLVARELGDRTRPSGVVTIAGQEWQAYAVRDGERALVLTRPDRTLIIIGRADVAELQQLAAALA